MIKHKKNNAVPIGTCIALLLNPDCASMDETQFHYNYLEHF